MGWIGKLLGGGEQRKPATPPAAPGAMDAGQAEEGKDESQGEGAATPREVDVAWYRWLAAAGTRPAAPALEARLLDQLARLAADPEAGAALVPRVPEIIPRLLRILQDEDMNVAVLSRQLAQDPVLVAELYREANRPCYRPRYHAGPPINSLDAAILLLGQNGMRMLLMRVALRPLMSMQSGRLARRAAPEIWRQSEKCALAASMLAPAQRAPAFEAYLAGLMQYVGLIVAFRLLDQMEGEQALPQAEDFVAALFDATRRLSARIATLWEFPDSVAAAIAGERETPLSLALGQGDRIAKLRMLVDGGRYGADDPFVAAGLDKAGLAAFAAVADEDDA